MKWGRSQNSREVCGKSNPGQVEWGLGWLLEWVYLLISPLFRSHPSLFAFAPVRLPDATPLRVPHSTSKQAKGKVERESKREGGERREERGERREERGERSEGGGEERGERREEKGGRDGGRREERGERRDGERRDGERREERGEMEGGERRDGGRREECSAHRLARAPVVPIQHRYPPCSQPVI